jgi:hypothetical protein
LKNIIISQQAIQFLHRKNGKRYIHLVIYRDIAKTGCWYSAKALTFIIKTKVMNKKPNEYFVMYDDSYGIPVWIEKGILKQLENKPILISVKKNGFIKCLNLDIGAQLLERR